MTLVIEAEPELMERLQKAATEAGMPIAELARTLLRKQVHLDDAPGPNEVGGAPCKARGAKKPTADTRVHDPFRGMFADDPELIEEIVEEAMRAREERPFRGPDG
jgi:hypothetical protein